MNTCELMFKIFKMVINRMFRNMNQQQSNNGVQWCDLGNINLFSRLIIHLHFNFNK